MHNPPTLIPTHPSFRRSDKVWTKTAARPLRGTGKAAAAWAMAHFLGVPVPWSAVRQASAADRAVTQSLQAALGLMDIQVLDHVIVAPGAALSMAGQGML